MQIIQKSKFMRTNAVKILLLTMIIVGCEKIELEDQKKSRVALEDQAKKTDLAIVVSTQKNSEIENPLNPNNPMEEYGLAIYETFEQTNAAKKKNRISYQNMLLEIGATLLPDVIPSETTCGEFESQLLVEIMAIFENNQDNWTELLNGTRDKEQYILGSAELSDDSRNALLATISVLKFYHYSFMTQGIMIDGVDILIGQPSFDDLWDSCMRGHIGGPVSSIFWVLSGTIFIDGIDCAWNAI